MSTLVESQKKEGRLYQDESNRVVRFAYIKGAVLAMMQGNNEAAVPFNYLFNPSHPDAKTVSFSTITQFGFDPWLLISRR
ncbi:hypothetical protein OLMES_4539 [Oleiphilus messinensis]|uniref:Uncharacterized protein n=1 Tax=Oleiphilus messinensis TaxID=141451 RepID=A0A1Y0IG98_9GAMM|nr:hypothetical protein [Oleiphilus messinensis]ARU58535.1 hypothetical protein OLMES_4539 [Oleiphilus messinensis]